MTFGAYEEDQKKGCTHAALAESCLLNIGGTAEFGWGLDRYLPVLVATPTTDDTSRFTCSTGCEYSILERVVESIELIASTNNRWRNGI